MTTSKLGFLSSPLSEDEKKRIDAVFGLSDSLYAQSDLFYRIYMKTYNTANEYNGDAVVEPVLLATLEYRFAEVAREWFDAARKHFGDYHTIEDFKITPFLEKNTELGVGLSIGLKLTPKLELLHKGELPHFHIEPDYSEHVISQYNLNLFEKPMPEDADSLVRMNKLFNDYITDRINDSHVGTRRGYDHTDFIAKILKVANSGQ